MRSSSFVLGLVMAASCVPADEAVGLGSVSFQIEASEQTRRGIGPDETADGWSLRIERVVVGFKTMTIGQIGTPDVCAYRGRGAQSDVVIDLLAGAEQTFNGITPTRCPDVGIILGPPGDATTLAWTATSADLLELATGDPAHAFVEAVALPPPLAVDEPSVRIRLRFDTARTGSRFGGCRDGARGIEVRAGERDRIAVRFGVENLFRDAISTAARLRITPFVTADLVNDGNGIVTMAELDVLPLQGFGGGYQLSDGSREGSLGDYVRELFRFAFEFRTATGFCVGNGPDDAP